MIDPFGVLLGLIRDDAAVQAIAGTRVSSEVTAPDSVRLTDLVTTKRPFGPGSGRLGLLAWIGAAHCYGADDPAGAIRAFRLAAAVSDALDQRGSHTDGSGRLVIRAYAPDVEGKERDPDTRWPFYTVPITAYLAAEAVA